MQHIYLFSIVRIQRQRITGWPKYTPILKELKIFWRVRRCLSEPSSWRWTPGTTNVPQARNIQWLWAGKIWKVNIYHRSPALHWRRNDHDSVPNHQPHGFFTQPFIQTDVDQRKDQSSASSCSAGACQVHLLSITLDMLKCFKNHKRYILILIVSWIWFHSSRWNQLWNNNTCCLFSRAMPADALATLGARASTSMVLAPKSGNIPSTASKELREISYRSTRIKAWISNYTHINRWDVITLTSTAV